MENRRKSTVISVELEVFPFRYFDLIHVLDNDEYGALQVTVA